MKNLVVTLAIVAALGLAAATAQAGNPYRDYYGPYAPNYGYQVNNYYSDWAPGPYYRGNDAHYYGGNDAHSEAVQRIMAAHSRYRYYTHPRSMHNSPPAQADYFGWGWDY
jgi:hypothetical protein